MARKPSCALASLSQAGRVDMAMDWEESSARLAGASLRCPLDAPQSSSRPWPLGKTVQGTSSPPLLAFSPEGPKHYPENLTWYSQEYQQEEPGHLHAWALSLPRALVCTARSFSCISLGYSEQLAYECPTWTHWP